ncbi:MAG: glycosyltransferase [Desulfomonile tiedjei]|nr:glycosyltransferase [Desulfomonile tiedjei]
MAQTGEGSTASPHKGQESSPLISIVLPTFNGARFIRECIDSVLSQTIRDLELIVVVDGSTDDTEAILRTYDDSRITTIVTENRGQARAMNTGFEIARGNYWSWTSDDNVYLPDAFAVMARYLDDHPDYAGVSTDCLAINETGRVVSYQEFAWQCFLYRADVGKSLERHRPEARILEDVDFFLRLRHYGGPIGRISRPYLKYRYHKNMITVTQRNDRPLISLKLNYDYHVNGVVDLDLKELFLDRLSQACLQRNFEAMNEMIAFAAEKRVPFLDLLIARKRYLQTSVGWLTNRLRIALLSQGLRLRRFAKLIRYGLSKYT